MSEKVMTELPRGIVREIAHWAEEEKVDKSTLLTKMKQVLLQGAKQLIQSRNWSNWDYGFLLRY